MASGIVAKQFTMVVNEVLPGVQVPAIYPQRQRQLTSLSYNTNTACILHRSPRLVVTMILCLLLDYKTKYFV